MSNAINRQTKKTINDMVQRVQTLNRGMSDMRFETCQILYTLRVGNAFTLVGADNWKEFIEEFNLGIKYASANRHAQFYEHYKKKLKYSNTDCVQIIEKIGLNSAVELISSQPNKTAISRIVNKHKKMAKEHQTFNIRLPLTEAIAFAEILQTYGMETSEHGYRMKQSEAAELFIRNYKSGKSTGKQQTLKLVKAA